MFRRDKNANSFTQRLLQIPDHFMVLGEGCLKALFKFLMIPYVSRRTGEFPGSPVIRTPQSQCQGPKFNSWSETTVSVQPKKKKKVSRRTGST